MPYALLDERTKKSNRDSLREAVRTFVGYGYNIEPSDQELGNELRLFILVPDDWNVISAEMLTLNKSNMYS